MYMTITPHQELTFKFFFLRLATVLVLAQSVFPSKTALGTTIKELSLNQLTNEAELIFEGRVKDRNVIREGRLITTIVTFEILDVIKGEKNTTKLDLHFSGGELDGEVLEITGSKIPAKSEHGIYFVESAEKNLLNPLLGWTQGHYIIKDNRAFNANVNATPNTSDLGKTVSLDAEGFKARLRNIAN
jgi:hypothetical protein